MNIQPSTPHPYHHGDLAHALLAEAERMLEADGVPALTLRAIARAAGVSHTAPSHHFGDLTGLLSELAALGHRRMAAALTAAIEERAKTPSAGAIAVGVAYVAFAQRHPGLFALMMRTEKLDADRPALKAARAESRLALRRIATGPSGVEPKSPIEAAARGVALWSLAHGYAVLLNEGRLKGTLAALPPEVAPEAFLEAVLGSLTFRS